ncbi:MULTISPECIES: protein rep [Cupriavidus]|uniref:protein rep n=1 Tax=Cupriavidus TaxID=106589 RepID=UPI0011C02A83|nr:protein rep [Cupriavidus taiwanensis]
MDPETGEILGVARLPADFRWARFATQAVSRRLLPEFRVHNCLRVRSKGREIQVVQSIEYKTASYKGLQTCGSVWVCPVCAAKISERRRVELQAAVALHQAQGGQVLLMTLTTPHGRHDDLAKVLDRQAKALKSFNAGRAAQALFDDMGCIGQIRALEVTHGRKRAVNNGWHPHYHILLFVRSGVDLEAFQGRLFERWRDACVKAGLKAPSEEHGVRLDDGSKAASYASKWGLESEMTKGHIKVAKDGETPFDFLRAYLEDQDKQAAALFVEFATVFKGKRQLHWSRGLKKRFGIGEASDEEVAAKQDDQAVLLGSISLEQWRAVLRHEGRAIVLELAEKQGWEAVQSYLNSISVRSFENDQCSEEGGVCSDGGARHSGVGVGGSGSSGEADGTAPGAGQLPVARRRAGAAPGDRVPGGEGDGDGAVRRPDWLVRRRDV